MNKKQEKILKDNFNVYKAKTWDLEAWTDGGVDMFINIDPADDIVKQLEEYIDNFDIDEEIDLYRQAEDYRKAFTITESVKDFEDWLEWVKGIIDELKGNTKYKIPNNVQQYQNLIAMLRELNLNKNSIETIKEVLDYIANELEKYIDFIK